MADHLFDGDRGMVLALGGAFAGLAAEHLTRGVLSGLGRFGWYGTQLAVDGGLRIVVAGAMWLAGVQSPVAFALVLAIAPAAAVLLTLPPVLRGLRPGDPRARWPPLCTGLFLLVASSLLAQVVANIGVINVQLLGTGRRRGYRRRPAVGADPGPHPAVRVRVAAGVAAAGADPGHRGRRPRRATATSCVRALGVVGLLGVVGAVPAVVFGPWLAELMFDAPGGALTRVDFAWLTFGVLAYMFATVLGQAVVARGWHAGQAVGWLVGTIALVAVTLGPGDVRIRVELAFAIGSLAVIPVVLPFAWRRGPLPAQDDIPPDPTPTLAAGRPAD